MTLGVMHVTVDMVDLLHIFKFALCKLQ